MSLEIEFKGTIIIVDNDYFENGILQYNIRNENYVLIVFKNGSLYLKEFTTTETVGTAAFLAVLTQVINDLEAEINP